MGIVETNLATQLSKDEDIDHDSDDDGGEGDINCKVGWATTVATGVAVPCCRAKRRDGVCPI